MVYAALALARTELLWYIRHYQKPAPKYSKHRERDYVDVSVGALLHTMQRVCDLVLTHHKGTCGCVCVSVCVSCSLDHFAFIQCTC